MNELQNYQIAEFALRASYNDLHGETVEQLKRHLLDSLGSMIFSINQPTIQKLRRQILFLESDNNIPARRISIDRAAQFYTALIRYPDFMDNYLGKEATCHPSDNIGSLLAVAARRKVSGEEFLTAMAVAYQTECRLVEEIPVMKEGIDHTLFLSYSIITSVGKLIGLSRDQLANGLAIAGCSICPMVTTRASYTYEWKGFASSQEALNCVNIAFLAKENMTGPVALFEGPKGFGEIFGMDLLYDWRNEGFDLIKKCILKTYNAEVHTQSAIDAALQLKKKYGFQASEISNVEVTTFLTAYHITGSGSYGDRQNVKSKEQADHSLFYVIAAALIDDEVGPRQFMPERIVRDDVQQMLKKISVKMALPIHNPRTIVEKIDPFTAVYPEKIRAKVRITLTNGHTCSLQVDDYPGFFTRPMGWDAVIEKFDMLTQDVAGVELRRSIVEKIRNLETATMDELVTEIFTPMALETLARY
jgi:2-methylcitrate dehydratase